MLNGNNFCYWNGGIWDLGFRHPFGGKIKKCTRICLPDALLNQIKKALFLFFICPYAYYDINRAKTYQAGKYKYSRQN